MWIVLAVTTLWLAVPVIQLVVMTVQLLRTPLWPMEILPIEGQADLSSDQNAAAAELELLGFKRVAQDMTQYGPNRHLTIIFRHESAPAAATLSFEPGFYAGYPIYFISFDANGAVFFTTNRRGWAEYLREPDIMLQDPYAANLLEHWQAHLARLAHAAPLPLGDDELRQRVLKLLVIQLDSLQEKGIASRVNSTWQFTPRAALRTAWKWLKVRHKLAVPYTSVVTQGEHQNAYFAQCYSYVERTQAQRSSRRDVKAALLGISLLVFLLLWGLTFGWLQAISLGIILLVHEGGHALAMRALGYRDMNMFFIPFVGAMVTGTAKDLAAWKQAIVLLAGPVPGILVGIALFIYVNNHPPINSGFDWEAVATMAIIVNLFNLLPFTPLDGGRLAEIALFSRWPRLRLVFIIVSVAAFVALALWQKGIFGWIVAAVLMRSLMSQWRITQLQRAWKEGVSHTEQLTNLYGMVRKTLGVQTFARQYGLVRAVVAQRQLLKPKAWESLIVLVLLTGLWSTIGVMGYFNWSGRPAYAQAEDHRTAAQRAFDSAWSAYEDDDRSVPDLSALDRHSWDLDLSDPRHVDLSVAKARVVPWPARQAALETVLAQQRPGYSYTPDDVAAELLWDVYENSKELTPQGRAVVLREAIDRVTSLAPNAYAGTIEARLRFAEAVDQSSDAGQALAILDDLRQWVTGVDGCQCARSIFSAQTWFYLSHSQPDRAIMLLETSPYGKNLHDDGEPLSLDYAWALLQAKRTNEALIEMRHAAYHGQPRPQTLLQRLLGVRKRTSVLTHPLDLAYALIKADRTPEARQLLKDRQQWVCSWATRNPGDLFIPPWQQGRESARREAALSICP